MYHSDTLPVPNEIAYEQYMSLVRPAHQWYDKYMYARSTKRPLDVTADEAFHNLCVETSKLEQSLVANPDHHQRNLITNALTAAYCMLGKATVLRELNEQN